MLDGSFCGVITLLLFVRVDCGVVQVKFILKVHDMILCSIYLQLFSGS